MKNLAEISLECSKSGLYNITSRVEHALGDLCDKIQKKEGVAHLFCQHTSCALLINESFDPSAKKDLELFFDYLAPEHLPFITHTLEGPDDSPAHMKSSILHSSLSLIVEDKKLFLGAWQGIFLAEFRNKFHRRNLLLKFQPDQ